MHHFALLFCDLRAPSRAIALRPELSLVKSSSARKIERLGPPFLTADSRSDRTPEVEIVPAISQRSPP